MAKASKRNLEEPELRFTTSVDVKDDLRELYAGDPGQRHARQRTCLDAVLADDTVDRSAFRKYEYGGQRRCFFNILVALEWSPSRAYLEALNDAFRQASKLLIDVTDGYAAIGQVAIGGPELMACADIQIFASNRLFPRASVNGLNDPEKYQPIRLGRGLWSKNTRTTIPWDDRKGYATLVHEWGHYALGLKDQYLNLDSASGLVTPSRSLVKDTIMAGLDKSELLSSRPNRRDDAEDSEWEALRRHPRFKWLEIDPDHQAQEAPPPEVVTPMFRLIGTSTNDPQELLFTLDGARADDRAVDPAHCWVYVVKGDLANPTGLLAQGSFERSGDFRLLGAASGDLVVLIGDQQGAAGRPIVLWAQIRAAANGSAVMGDWYDATPEPFPTVDVTAANASTSPPFSVKLSGFDPKIWNATLFPLGRPPQPANTPVTGLEVLDGHVMLVSTGKRGRKLAIASYAQGGSPFSGYPAHPNPIPAGSADGNAMLFFYDEHDEPLSYTKLYPDAGEPPAGPKFNASKVITTTNLENNARPPAGWEPRGYIFSITNYGSLKEVVNLHPTLVLYYDQETREQDANQLAIGRYNPGLGEWEMPETKDQKDQRESFFIAAPLSPATAPGLYDAPLRAEHYRLFLSKVRPAS